MLNENDVVAIVEQYLCDKGWKILRRSSTTQTGPDLEAQHPTSLRLVVEAKGATSARSGSRRHGQPFNRNQARVHVANAFYAAAKVRDDEHASAIALPRTPPHEDFVEAIRRALVKLQIAVLWVGEDRAVTTWNWPDDRGSE